MMTTSNFKPFLFSLGIITLFLVSCNDASDEVLMTYTNGAFISCEGNFGSGNASISFYSKTTDSVYTDIFNDVNQRTIGDVLQSITIHNGNSYLVVNNSSKVEVVDASTFEVKGVISGVSSPRYLVANENTAWVSCWGDNTVNIVDLESLEVTGSITASSGPDKMLIHDEKLYIANSGGWSVDSIISVVDINTNSIIKEIEVKYAPTDLVVDPEGNIWVLCFGKIIYDSEEPYPILEETASKLFKIDSQTDEVVEEIPLFDTQHPAQLEIDSEGNLFFGGGYTFEGLWRLQNESGPGNLKKIIEDYAYGFNIDPETDEVYITIATSYTSGGILKRYSSNGTELGSYECGIGPNGTVFSVTE